MNKKLIFVGYNLTQEELSTKSLVSGEIKNANYLMKSIVEQGVDVLPLSICLSGEPEVKNFVKKSSAKGVFRWYKEAKEINTILKKLMDRDTTIYLTIPSYLPFLDISNHCKVIITAHGTYWPELLADLKYEKNWIKKFLHYANGKIQLIIDKASFKKADFIHSVSDFQVKEMIETYKIPQKKIISIRNGSDFEKSNGLNNDGYDFIWVGRLAKKKNINLFINFVKKVGFRKVCICKGNDYFAIDKYSKKIIDNLKNDTRFEIFDDLPDEKLCKLMNKSRYLVVSSTGYESIPTVIFEGVASGCKVLAPNSWGVSEVESNGVYTYIEGDINSLVSSYKESQMECIDVVLNKEAKWQFRASKFKEMFEL